MKDVWNTIEGTTSRKLLARERILVVLRDGFTQEYEAGDPFPRGCWEEGTDEDELNISKENAFRRNRRELRNSWSNISRHGPLVGLNLRMHLVQGADCDCFCTQALSVWHLGPSSMAEILCAMKTRSQKRCSSWLLHAFSSTSPCSEDLSAWDALQNPARAPDLTFWRFSSKCLGEEGKRFDAFGRGWVTLKAKVCQCTWLFLVSLCHAVTGAHRAIDHPPLGNDRTWPQLQQRPSQCSVGANCVQHSTVVSSTTPP